VTKEKILTFFNQWLPPIFWAGLIFYLSSIPNLRASSDVFFDEIIRSAAHGIMYAALFLLVFRAINFKKKTRNFLIPFFLSVFYFLSDEVHQSFVPTRTFQTNDLVIDFLGVLFGVIILWKLLPKAPKKLKNLANKLQLS